MNDSPLASEPFQYSITDPVFNPVKVGASLGMKCGVLLALPYGFGLPVLWLLVMFPLIPLRSASLHDFPTVLQHIGGIYGSIALFGTVMPLFGMIPASIIGYVNGWLIGKMIQRWLPDPLSPHQAIHVGFWMSAFLLAVRVGVVGFCSARGFENDPMLWIFWYGPNPIAFLGLWWVAYRVNMKMGIPPGSLALPETR